MGAKKSEQTEEQTQLPTETLNDQMKVDYLKEVFAHYSLEEIEKALPRRY